MVILAALLFQFRFIIGPLILAFVLAYLLYPLANWLNKRTHLPWRTTAGLIFLVLVIIVAALVVLLGFAVVQQVQSLFNVVQDFVNNDIPRIVANLSDQNFQFGVFVIDFSQFRLEDLVNQLVPNLQAPLTQVGSLIGSLATVTLGTLGWVAFVLVVAYFLLAGTDTVTGTLFPIELPGYTEDIRQMGIRLRKIWNNFLRGQLTLIFMIIIVCSIVFLILGIRYALALAVLAGLARFVPYVGPVTAAVVMFMIAIFQGSNYFGLQQWFYAMLVIFCYFLVDQSFDNLVAPRFLGVTLEVHPAALLVTAIVAFKLLGVIGLVLAAPVLATLVMFSRYILRKMLDEDPFPPTDERTRPKPVEVQWNRFKKAWNKLRK
jgi:predicted PurR-regulated permease PerM